MVARRLSRSTRASASTAEAGPARPECFGPVAGIIRAGDLFDRLTYYRNDRTPTSGSNPHGFLADPTLFGRQQGELQLSTFLKTGTIVDPDGPGPLFETPIANRDNLQCLHYPDPQTSDRAFPPAAAGECPPRPADADVAPFTGGEEGQGGTPDQGAPNLPTTGLAPGLAALAVLLLALGAALRRRTA